MHRVIIATVLAVTALLSFASCAQTTVSASDIYKIGCPAVDAAAESGSVVNKVTVSGLKATQSVGQARPRATTMGGCDYQPAGVRQP